MRSAIADRSASLRLCGRLLARTLADEALTGLMHVLVAHFAFSARTFNFRFLCRQRSLLLLAVAL